MSHASDEQVIARQPLASAEDYALVGLPSEESLRALKAFCKQLVGTPFLPASLVKDLDFDQQVGTLLSVILTGREMNLSPMQSLRSFWLSPDGRLGMYADAMMALMLKAGMKPTWERLDEGGAVLAVERVGIGQYRTEFTASDAARAGLAGKGPWGKYPRQMCKARVIGDAFRTLFPDLGGSNMYTKEEIMDMEPDATGAYSRERVEAESDKQAEGDPALALKPKKVIEAPAQIIEMPVVAKTPEPEPKFTPAVTVQAPAVDGKKYTATDADIPANIGGQPAPPPTPVQAAIKAAQQRTQAIAATLEVEFKVMGNYVVAYNGGSLAALPESERPTHWSAALDAFEAELRLDQDAPKRLADELKADAKKVGDRLRKKAAKAQSVATDESVDPITARFGWTGETLALARKLKGQKTVGGFIDALSGLGFASLPSDQVLPALKLYGHGNNAYLLVKNAALTPSVALQMLEAHLAEPLTDITAAIQLVMRDIKGGTNAG